MFSSVTSVIALFVSITVAYLTLFRRGKLGMTRPVLVGFLSEEGQPKLFAADPFNGGIRILITGPHGFEHTVTFAIDDDPALIAERVREMMEE